MTTPVTKADLVDALGCFWNAAIGESHRQQEAMSFAAIMATGIAAVAQRLEELDEAVDMSAPHQACPFCGGKRTKTDAGFHGMYVMCLSCYCQSRQMETATQAADAWNRRTDLSQASVAAALEAAAAIADEDWEGEGIAAQIRDLITPDQRTALQAAIDAAKAKARAEIYAQIEAMPRREELLSGQRTQYAQLHEVLAWIGAKP